MGLFIKAGARMGYRLVSFIGTNAFFVHRDAGLADDLPTLSGEEAALQNLQLVKANKFAREYLFLVNRGKQQPGYAFNNPLFDRKSLGLGFFEARRLVRTNHATA